MLGKIRAIAGGAAQPSRTVAGAVSRLFAALVSGACLCAPYQAAASTGNDASATGPGAPTTVSSNDLDEVVVTSRYEFLSVDTSGATGLPVPIDKVPQSISLVSADFIKAADLKTLSDIAEYTPGAINVGNPENSGTAIELRGFSPGRAVDGINVIQSFEFYEPDNAIFDRLEVVKGPSSVVYGVSSPGGVVNYVTKSATADTPDYLYLQAGNWKNFRFEGQIAGALDSDGHIRAIGIAVQDQGDSFLNQMYHRKTSLYGGINVDFTDSVSGYLHGGYERFERPTFDGVPTEPDGTAAPVPRSFCICSENIVLTNSVYHLEGEMSWHVTPMLDVSIRGNYERDAVSGSEDYSYGLTENGDISTVVADYDQVRYNNYGIGLSAVYKLDDLGLKNSFVSLGALYQNSSQGGSFPSASGSTNLFLGQAAVSQSLVALTTVPFQPFTQITDASTRTVSAQSMLEVLDPLTILLGVSSSKPDETETTLGGAQNFGIGSQVSYRAGLNYEIVDARTNAYFSYSQSFEPQLYLDINNVALPPLKGDQYELGLKHRSMDGRILVTGGLFDIKEKNVGEFAAQVGGVEYFQAVGEVTHKGVELQALGQIAPQWQINAGYAYLDPKVTEDVNSAEVGETQLFLPKQTFSLYSTYTLQSGSLRGLSFGGGARYVSNQRTAYVSALANTEAGLTPTKDLPGYFLADATLSYSLDKWLVQLNGHNLFNRRYFLNNYQTLFYGNAPGAPVNIALAVRRSF